MPCTCHLYSIGDVCDECLNKYVPSVPLEEEYKRAFAFARGLPAADLLKVDPAQQAADAEKLRRWVKAVGA